MFNFHPDCRFTQDWCSASIQGAIHVLATSTKGLPGLNIEIGCFEGRSTVVMANALSPETLIAIDPWHPVDYAPREIELYGQYEIEKTFLHNIKVGTPGNVQIMKMGWEEAFEKNIDEDIKFLYLDGPHGYEDVLHQLESIMPRMAENFILCGDDYADHGVQQAVDEFFGRSKINTPTGQTWVYREGA